MTAVPLSVGRPRRAAAPAPRRAQPRPRPQLSVVDVDSRRRARRIRWAVRGLVVLVVAALLSAVAFHVALAQGQVRLDALERDVAVAEQRYEQRRLALAQASSPEHISARALELGLVPPSGPAETVTVPEDAVPPAAGETSSTLDHQGDVKASASP
jgi:hypothetical protein